MTSVVQPLAARVQRLLSTDPVQRLLSAGRSIRPKAEPKALHPDIEREIPELIALVCPDEPKFQEKLYSAVLAARHVARGNIPGAVVECGVWQGRSAMAMAVTLLQEGDTSRQIYLYDTYAGMPEPTERDRKFDGKFADSGLVRTKWQDHAGQGGNEWKLATEAEVKANVASTGYPEDQLVLVKGMVEDTLPGTVPESVSILRLDTDFYDSTYHELVHLYPRLSVGGVLILDDYGHWVGSKEAADQYFAEQGIHLLLTRVDSNARMAVKTEPGP